MADDITALHIFALFGALVGNVAQKDHAVAGSGMKYYVLLRFAPRLEFGAVDGIEVGRLGSVAVFNEFQMLEGPEYRYF